MATYTLLLSYDASESEYNKNPNFRVDLAKFIKTKGGTDLQSFTASTIVFKTTKETPTTIWEMSFREKYPDNFYFTLVRIANDGKSILFVYFGVTMPEISA